jgi:hypothetical protein
LERRLWFFDEAGWLEIRPVTARQYGYQNPQHEMRQGGSALLNKAML